MSDKGKLKFGAIHPITGRQWDLENSEAWPDLEIVLPFKRRVIDRTGTIIDYAGSAEKIGGYDVVHSLEKVEIYDADKKVENIRGVWAAGPGGDTARIHLPSQDPFSWLTPHVDTISKTIVTPPNFVEQLFGCGSAETFTSQRRFGELLVKPETKAELLNDFQMYLANRIMKSEKINLCFRTLDGDPIHIDQFSMLILGRDATRTSNLVQVSPGIVTSSYAKPICGDLSMFKIDLELPAATDSISIESLKDSILYVYAVRYREARRFITNWSEKVILVPSKYRITIKGKSKATSYTDPSLPDSDTVEWELEKEFSVKYPETLRPYIAYGTIGDSRIFSTMPPTPPPSLLAWNPTDLGVGFPSYRKYVPLVRFLVSYMHKIFKPINMKVVYEKTDLTISEDLLPQQNGDGDSSLDLKSRNWITAAGGYVSPDEEIIFTQELTQEGPAMVVLSAKIDGKEVKLDGWNCYVSRFESFSQHLDWEGNCLQTYYNKFGKHTVPSCPMLSSAKLAQKRPFGLANTSSTNTNILKTDEKRDHSDVMSTRWVPSEESQPYPDELNSPPIDWRLPSSITDHLKPLDKHTGLRYARFAHETSVRFNEGDGDKLDGIQDKVETTILEAVVDDQGRPFALWLRTPEPVDWRRVKATLKIKHVNQTDRCPTEYANRKQMDFTINILPSPDASSAFLIGYFDKIATKLPRGVYELNLSFNPFEPELEKLRPLASITPIPEQVKMTFVQPLGMEWPLPSTGIIIPAWILEKLIIEYQRPTPSGPIPSKLIRIYEDYIQFGKLIGVSQFERSSPVKKLAHDSVLHEAEQKTSEKQSKKPKRSTSTISTTTKTQKKLQEQSSSIKSTLLSKKSRETKKKAKTRKMQKSTEVKSK